MPSRWRPRLQRSASAALRRRIDAAPPPVSVEPGASADRRWYQVHNNAGISAMRFNLVGREGQGLVRSDEVGPLTEVLRAALLDIINVDTGRPAIVNVFTAEDAALERFDGDRFPDVFVEWDRSQPVERVWSPLIGTVVAPYELWRTGHHHDRGLLIACHPDVEPGHREPAMPLEDIAPTLSAALGVELRDVDGVPHPDLLGGGSAPSAALPTRQPSTSTGRANGRDANALVAERALHLAAAAARRSDAVARTEAATVDLADQLEQLRARTDDLERANLVWTTMRWLQGLQIEEDHLVSVITPTHERPDQLATAIRSVIAQTYGRWEMIVVDDGGDVAKSVVADIGDARVRAHAISHRGVTGARNAALDLAEGSLVTYLDDDNELDPDWLKAVVWGFQTHPDTEVLYGARLIDDAERVRHRAPGGWPWIQFNRFDRDSLLRGNLADIGVMAHRSGLPEARFDERLQEFGDWELFLALTEHRVPLELPALALRYDTSGEDRLSGHHRDEVALVHERWPWDRPWP